MQTLLVTGGRVSAFFNVYESNKEDYLLSSTEIYVGSAWVYVASLPTRGGHMPAVTLDNSVYVFGESTICFTLYLTYYMYLQEDSHTGNTITILLLIIFSSTMELLTDGLMSGR